MTDSPTTDPRPRSPGTAAWRAARTPSDHAAVLLATWFGCGFFPRAPGTAGTVGTLPLYFLLAPAGWPAIAAAALVLNFVGVWAASRVVRLLAAKDPQIVCLDEVVGYLIALAAAPRTLAGVVVAFVLFRLFDVWKPWPARWAERNLPRGWGVMLDDVFAGIWAAALIAAARALHWL